MLLILPVTNALFRKGFCLSMRPWAGLSGTRSAGKWKGAVQPAGGHRIAAKFPAAEAHLWGRIHENDNPTYALWQSSIRSASRLMIWQALWYLNHPKTINDFQTAFLEQALFVPKASIGLDMAKKEYAAKDDDFIRKKKEVPAACIRTFLGSRPRRSSFSYRKGIEDTREPWGSRRHDITQSSGPLFRHAEAR